MSPVSKQWIRRAVLTLLVPVGALAMGAVDRRYVHADKYDKDRVTDSLRTNAQIDRSNLRDSLLNAKMDEALLRLQQIQCGRRIVEGCR